MDLAPRVGRDVAGYGSDCAGGMAISDALHIYATPLLSCVRQIWTPRAG